MIRAIDYCALSIGAACIAYTLASVIGSHTLAILQHVSQIIAR